MKFSKLKLVFACKYVIEIDYIQKENRNNMTMTFAKCLKQMR